MSRRPRLPSGAPAPRRTGREADRRAARWRLGAWPLLVIAALLAFAPARARAQDGLALRFDPAIEDAPVFDHAPLQASGRFVVIRLAVNRLYVLQNRHVIWSAPVGTGTGFRLEGGGHAWHFDTPRGVFRVQAREKDPVWIKPDWAFIEQHQPIPPADSPLRREPGGLGTTALYIGYQLAMHGTNRPALVLRPDPATRRVSHGCIRLTNEDARTLYYLADIGTPVLIY